MNINNFTYNEFEAEKIQSDLQEEILENLKLEKKDSQKKTRRNNHKQNKLIRKKKKRKYNEIKAIKIMGGKAPLVKKKRDDNNNIYTNRLYYSGVKSTVKKVSNKKLRQLEYFDTNGSVYKKISGNRPTHLQDDWFC